jgi:hypothetical protein
MKKFAIATPMVRAGISTSMRQTASLAIGDNITILGQRNAFNVAAIAAQ